MPAYVSHHAKDYLPKVFTSLLLLQINCGAIRIPYSDGIKRNATSLMVVRRFPFYYTTEHVAQC